MSEHDRIAKLLPLAAAGDLSAAEVRQVREHLGVCAGCRRMMEDYGVLGSALRGLPTPQPSAELLARVRVMAMTELTRKRTRNRDAWVLAPLVAGSWIAALVTWPWVRIAFAWIFSGYHLPGGTLAHALTIYSILGFVLASIAAVAVGRHAGTIGRRP